MLLRLAPSSPESDWAIKPFRLLLEHGSRDSCNKYNLFRIFVSFSDCFILLVALFCLSPLLGRILAGLIHFRE
jgi:hypothetical protein